MKLNLKNKIEIYNLKQDDSNKYYVTKIFSIILTIILIITRQYYNTILNHLSLLTRM